MAIKITCGCGKKLSVKDELAGRRVKCPACQKPLSVPKPKVEEEPTDDEWDFSSTSEDEYDDEEAVAAAKSHRAKYSSAASRKGGAKGSGATSQNRGLLIGLSAGCCWSRC